MFAGSVVGAAGTLIHMKRKGSDSDMTTVPTCIQVAWRGLGGAGGAPCWRISAALPLQPADSATTAASQPQVAAADVAAAAGGLRVLLLADSAPLGASDGGAVGSGDSGSIQQLLHVVDVEGSPMAAQPGAPS